MPSNKTQRRFEAWQQQISRGSLERHHPVASTHPEVESRAISAEKSLIVACIGGPKMFEFW